MSETLIGVIGNSGDDYVRKPTSIGLVSPNHDVKYVDEKGNEVPVNTSGWVWFELGVKLGVKDLVLDVFSWNLNLPVNSLSVGLRCSKSTTRRTKLPRSRSFLAAGSLLG